MAPKFNYSFKLFPRFWLVKTTRIIHHNKLLLIKFETNFVMMTSKVIIEPLTEKTWGRVCAIFGEQKNEVLIFSFKSLTIF